MSEKDVSLPANRAFVIQLQASSGASEVRHGELGEEQAPDELQRFVLTGGEAVVHVDTHDAAELGLAAFDAGVVEEPNAGVGRGLDTTQLLEDGGELRGPTEATLLQIIHTLE